MPAWVVPAALAAAGIGIGAGSSALSSLMSYQSAKKLQEHQYDLNQKAQRNYWQNARYSTTSAGYNPLLALGSGTQGFSASSSGVPVDLSSGVQSGLNSAMSAMQLGSQIKNIQADTALKTAQVDTESTRQVLNNSQSYINHLEGQIKNEELPWIQRKRAAEVKEILERAKLNRASAIANKMNADTNRINSQTQKYNNVFNWAHSALSQQAELFEKDHPYLSRTKYWRSYRSMVGK